jgi:hypothetical protein
VLYVCVVRFQSSELFHTKYLSDWFVLFSVTACEDMWKHIRTAFVGHLHAKKRFWSYATKKRPYYLHDAMQFTTFHIIKIGTRKMIWQRHKLKKIRHYLGETKKALR